MTTSRYPSARAERSPGSPVSTTAPSLLWPATPREDPRSHNEPRSSTRFYASVLIDAGESVRAVPGYLGHADPAFALRVYAHLFPSAEDRACEVVDRPFDPGTTKSVVPPAYDDKASRRPR